MSDPYDAFADQYREYSQTKSAYIAAVDNLILANAPKQINRMLDVGAGDGFRAMSLVHMLHPQEIVLLEPSTEMVKKCQRLKPTQVLHCKAEALLYMEVETKFDLVTCLWNVFGHVESQKNRLKVLKGIYQQLADTGLFILDVNNRYNIVNYGLLSVIKNVAKDIVLPNEKNGDVTFTWHIDDKAYPTFGHIFNPQEIESIIHQAGFVIKKRLAVNYQTGALSRSVYKGQLVYALSKG